MALWNRLTKKIRRLGFVSPLSSWESPPERNTRGYLSAYGEIYSLFGISLRIATAFSEAKWRLFKGNERSERTQIADSVILKLLDYANEFQTGQEIMELLSLHMDLAGKAYWYLPRNALGVPAEIWALPPHLIKIVPSKEKFIAGYIFDSGGERIPLGTNEVIRFPMPDPLNPYGGVGFAQASAVELDSEVFAGKWYRNFFYNSARPDAALEFEGNLTEDQFEKLREQWQSRHQGLSRAHKIAILQGGIKYRQIQINQKDMDFLQGRKLNRENLMFAFGMPQSVMGVSENVNRANAEAGDYTFARWLIRPRLIRIKNKLNEQLLPMFPMAKGVELDFDEVVPETLEMKKGLAESGVKAGWMTINEARKLNSLDPVPSGEVFLIPFNMMPTPADKPIKPPPSATPPAPKELKLTPDEWEDEYENGVPHWAVEMQPSKFVQEFVEELKKAKRINSVLEVGCGNGRDSIFMAKAGFKVTAVDVVPKAIELARQNAEDAEVEIDFRIANAEELPFEDKTFDAFYSLSVLHSTKLERSIAESARVAKKKALAFIYIYGDTEKVSGELEVTIDLDDYIAMLNGYYEMVDFYTEQESDYDEAGERHKIFVALLRRL